MAGFVADPGTQQTEGVLPTITARLNELGKKLGITIYGISGYRTPAHSVAVGGFADDPHTKGEAEDIAVNSQLRASAAQLTNKMLASVGLERPFDMSGQNPNEVNHIQLIPSNSLSKLWIDNGGNPKLANIMAAIALAESGGRQNATNKDSNGTVDYGLWQINSVHGFDAQKLLDDPNYNAKAAVSVEKSQGLGAWATYNSGAYLQFMGQAKTATILGPGPNGGIVRPSAQGGGSDNSRGRPPRDTIFSSYQTYSSDANATAPPGTDVSFWSMPLGPGWALGQLEEGWNQLTGAVSAGVTAINSTADLIDFLTKFLKLLLSNPLRLLELPIGLWLMWTGFKTFGSSRAPLADTGAGLRRITREVAASTPVGRASREFHGRKMGKREGQREAARMQARREATRGEREASSRERHMREASARKRARESLS